MTPLFSYIQRLNRHRWRAAALILMVLLAAGLVAPLTQAAPEKQVSNVLRIGYLGVRGSQTANGAELAIQQINESGSITASGTTYQLELVALDSEPTVDTLGEAIGKLVAQNVIALLGPDSNGLITPDNIQALANAKRPILTPATGDALTDYDQTNFIFRTRAPERVFSYALATYLTTDLGLTQIAAVQTEVEFTEALMHFESSLANAGVTLADKTQLPGGDTLATEAQRLVELNPQAIVLWGKYQDAATLLGALRDGGWQGVFAYRKANEAVQANVLPRSLADGVLGMDSWSYADTVPAARIFLRDYAVAFGEMPGPLAVSAYDAIWYLRFAIVDKGIDPAALQAALLSGNPRTLVQGVLHPLEFGNGDLSRTAVVYKLGPHGGSNVLARFDDISRLDVSQAGPTPTPEPGVTPLPPTSSVPTATLEGTWIKVNVDTLNIRIGPGPNYDKIGQAKRDDLFRVLGAVADYTWVAIDYNGGVAWAKTEFVQVLGSLATVNIVQPPATPTLAATVTPSLPQVVDLVIDSVTLNPVQPIPNQAFTATITVRNTGANAAGRFAVAATWAPGNVYTSSFVEGLAGGQTAQAFLVPTVTGTGTFQIAVIADLNNDTPDSNRGNNTYNVTYRVDYPLLTNQSNVAMDTSDKKLDLDNGGTMDIKWDGSTLTMLNGAKIGVLSGVTYENAHYDLLTSSVVNATSLSSGQVLAGAVYGVYTAEGKRAVVRIDNRADPTIWVSYRAYNAP